LHSLFPGKFEDNTQMLACDQRMRVPQGEFELARYPVRANEMLRAWDAADEFLLRHLAGTIESARLKGEILIVNDYAGALSTALAAQRPAMLSDSYLAHVATRKNLTRNGIDSSSFRQLASFDPLPESIDAMVMKIPKSLALLEDQLHRIVPHIHQKTIFIAGAMTKHIHASTLKLFANIVGTTRSSLAERKARLIFCDPNLPLERPSNPWPRTYTAGNHVVTSYAGVFSASRLDGGTSFLLDHLPRSLGPLRVVDLGCGNGILGVRTAFDNSKAEVTFIDESYRAVASAKATFRTNLGSERTARFSVGNGMFDLADDAPLSKGSIDRVLNNPPFHENNAIRDAVAWQMFSESRDVLRPGGELWVVGNHHLAYQAKLKRLFGNCKLVASNDRFVVLQAVRA
jgi:16S rRNA (guanine1207-N2)-methyltransferase